MDHGEKSVQLALAVQEETTGQTGSKDHWGWKEPRERVAHVEKKERVVRLESMVTRVFLEDLDPLELLEKRAHKGAKDGLALLEP